MLSEVAICNLALGWVGGNQILSLNDPLTEAVICKANYDPARRALLETVAWTWAQSREDASPVITPPAYVTNLEWNAFLRPANSLRIIKVTDVDEAYRLDWLREGDYILAPGERIRMHFTLDITDTSKFPPLFDQALAARIAAEIAIPVSQSRSLQQDMWGLASKKMSEAVSADQRQGSRQKLISNQLTRVR